MTQKSKYTRLHGEMWYWEASKALIKAGYDKTPKKLGKDREAAWKLAEQINAKIERARAARPPKDAAHGTLPWAIARYKESPKWTEQLAPRTRQNNAHLFRIVLRWSARHGDPHVQTIDVLEAQAFWNELKNNNGPNQAFSVVVQCKTLWNWMLRLKNESLVTHNPWAELQIKQPPGRKQVWRDGWIEAVIRTANTPGPWGRAKQRPSPDEPVRARPSAALAVGILADSLLRPCDVRALRWRHYDGEKLDLVQQKTQHRVTCFVAGDLKQALDAARREAEARLAASKVRSIVPLAEQLADQHILLNENTGAPWGKRPYAGSFAGSCVRPGSRMMSSSVICVGPERSLLPGPERRRTRLQRRRVTRTWTPRCGCSGTITLRSTRSMPRPPLRSSGRSVAGLRGPTENRRKRRMVAS